MQKLIDEYYQNTAPQRQKRLVSIHRLILKLYPKVSVSLRYKMPTFELGGNWVAVGNQKNYISVYTCCYDHIADFRTKHPQIKGGKGCLNFKDSDALFEADLKKVIQKALTNKKAPR